MSSREPGRWALFAGGIVLAMLLFAALVMIELLVDVPSRTAATRVAAALVLGLAIVKIRTLVRLRLDLQAGSAFEAATAHHSRAGWDRTRFHQLHDDVRLAARSQRHFDRVFWPHLLRLAKTAAPALEKPRGRAFGRGPSVETLARLVATIETER